MTLVRYLDTPVELFLELQETLDALQREVQLTALDGGAVGDDVVEGMVVHRDAMVQVRSDLYDQAMAARADGRAIADLEAEYPDDSVEAVLAITAAARTAQEAAARGTLLTPPLRPAVQALQAWVFAEVEAQLTGSGPTPYDGGRVGEGFTLRLRAVPVRGILDLLAAIDALHREVQVVAMDGGAEQAVDATVHDALVNDREHLEVPRNSIHDQAAAARAAGRTVTDIEAPYTWEEVPRALSATAAVGQADEAARRGDLLAPPMTDHQRHLWLWVGREFEAQADGAPPTPYVAPEGAPPGEGS